MSGIAEAIAIASCVAALISAYKDGSTILNKIKRRREIRGALPPTVYLERSLERGQTAIVGAVVEGREQFGPGYEFGDEIVIQAIKDITIDTQRALLSRLAAATEDDDITDFTECIAAADRGRLQATVVLSQYQLRRQAAMSQPLRPSQPAQPIQIATTDLRNWNSQVGQPPLRPAIDTSPNSAISSTPQVRRQTAQEASSPSEARTRRIPFFRRHSSNKRNLSIQSNESLTAHLSSNNYSQSPSSTMSSSPPTPLSANAVPSPNSQMNADIFNHRATNANGIPRLGVSHTNTSTVGSRPSRSSSFQALSARPGPDGTILCEYSYYLRVGLNDDGLTFYDQYIAGHGNYRFKCKSTSCAFQCVARELVDGRRWIDQKIRTSSGVQFRWLFLAKSHMKTILFSKPKFRCLICHLNGDSSSIYDGHIPLFEHISAHQGGQLGTTLLEGPLSFSDENVRVGDDNFDINFLSSADVVMRDEVQPATEVAMPRVVVVPNGNRETHWSDEFDDPWHGAQVNES